MEVIVLQHLGQVFPFPRPSTPSSSFLSRFGQHECLPPQTPHSHPVRFLHLISSWAFFPVPGCHPTISSQEKTQTLGLSAQGKLRHTEGGGSAPLAGACWAGRDKPGPVTHCAHPQAVCITPQSLPPLCPLPKLQHWAPPAPLGREMFSLSPPVLLASSE